MAVQQANRSNDGNKPQDQGPRTSSFVGMLVVIVVVLTLNWLVFPKMSGQRIIPTDYGTFINKVDSGLVEKVMIKNDYIYFLTDEGDNGKTTYSTGSVGDPGLVDRLLAAKSPNEDGRIAFTREIPRENSPIMNFILLWVLPFLIFYLIWRQAGKSIQSRLGAGGGNFMSFGGSGAKIYADSDVRTTFADVAKYRK